MDGKFYFFFPSFLETSGFLIAIRFYSLSEYNVLVAGSCFFFFFYTLKDKFESFPIEFKLEFNSL